MGSETDLEFCRQVAKQAKTLGLEYEFRVASAHRTNSRVAYSDVLSWCAALENWKFWVQIQRVNQMFIFHK
jgi:hypothetical protein